jgi:hypothetical protein
MTDIQKKRLEWIGPVVRMYQGRTIKEIYIRVNRMEVEEGEDLDFFNKYLLTTCFITW